MPAAHSHVPLDFYTMNEDEEPDWLAELAKGGDTVRRQIELLVQGAQQFVREGQEASGGPVPPFQLRVVRAVGAAMRELTPARQPVVHQRTASLILTPVMTAVPTVTVTGGLALAPMGFSGQETVQNPADTAEWNIGRILALVIAAMVTGGLMVVPEHDWAAEDHYLTVIGFGLTISALIWSTQRKQK